MSKTKPNESVNLIPAHENHFGNHVQESYGLTKREEFARSMMQSIIAGVHIAESPEHAKITRELCSKLAVEMADALIAELNKESV